MNLEELEARLVGFCRAMYRDESAQVVDVAKMPGHAGFSFGFTVHSRSLRESWCLRLPPPGVKWQGTADVLRQVAVLNALEGEPIPHCPVRWSSDDLRWFGRPYFVVPKLAGDVVHLELGGWTARLSDHVRRSMARQAMTALARLHQVDWHKADYLGSPIDPVEDVVRWDRFIEKAADRERLARAPDVRELLLAQVPTTSVGIFHGDFQWGNLFYSPGGELLAVIDWELVGVGATANDLGWFATFNDPAAWAANRFCAKLMPPVEELIETYVEAFGARVPDLNWFRALAAYKFAIISGFNLMLHRRGKRPDPSWETTKESIEPLLDRAHQLLRR
jgi:aminoglycoside phosphotransferase (APT) family kinase protein